jgi:hypothetical protein
LKRTAATRRVSRQRGSGAVFRFIGEFLGKLWRFSNFWRVSPIGEARIGSPLAGGLLFLVLLFGVIGLILTVLGLIFGFTLADVDVFLDRQGGWMDFVGTILIQKVLMAIVLLFCVLMAGTLLFFRDSESPSWLKTIGILLLCLFVGYCSTVNMIAPLDTRDPAPAASYYDSKP